MEQIKIQEATRQREAAQRAPNAETVRHLFMNIFGRSSIQGASGQVQQAPNMARGPVQGSSAHGFPQQFPPQAQSVPQPAQGLLRRKF